VEFNFEKLEVWQLTMDLIDEAYELLNKYPRHERFALVDNGRRSVTSIALNIAEGSIRGKREFNQFVRIALGSLVETIASLKIGVRRGYLSEADFNQIKSAEPLYFKLIKLSKSLKENTHG
jgi:four helix bundle protein